MNKLLPRILSALGAVLILFGTVYLGKNALLTLCLLASIICLYEFRKLIPFNQYFQGPSQTWFTVLFITSGLLVFICALYSSSQFVYWIALVSVGLAAMMLVLISKKGSLEGAIHVGGITLIGIIHSGLLPAFSALLLTMQNGLYLFLCHLSLVFGGDILAYFVGSTFGKKKLAPALSPKKTVAGAVGGLAGSLVFGFTAYYFSIGINKIAIFSIACVITGIFAQFGDLFVSLFKRTAQVKDTGHIMPGHGGLLDRIDGVLFSSPVFIFICQLVGF